MAGWIIFVCGLAAGFLVTSLIYLAHAAIEEFSDRMRDNAEINQELVTHIKTLAKAHIEFKSEACAKLEKIDKKLTERKKEPSPPDNETKGNMEDRSI